MDTKQIKEYMDWEYKRRVANKEYGGYFYLFQNDRYIGRMKNQAQGLYYLLGAYLTNTTQSISTGTTFTPSNYNDSSAGYALTTTMSENGVTLNAYLSYSTSTSTSSSSIGGSVTTSITDNYLGIILQFGIADSSTTSGTITQLQLNLQSSASGTSANLITSTVSIPFNPSAAVSITYQLVI